MSLIVRAADMGGSLEAFANGRARAITLEERTTIPTRHGGWGPEHSRGLEVYRCSMTAISLVPA